MRVVTLLERIGVESECVAIIDDADWELVKDYKWRLMRRQGVPTYVHESRWINGKHRHTFMHKLIFGSHQNTVQVDHINRIKLDNRRSNLRACTPSQNSANRISWRRSKSKYKGIYWTANMKKWRSIIRHDGKNTHLGYFERPEDAARAHDKACLKTFGEFAILNFPVEVSV